MATNYTNLQVGQEIKYTGDMANHEGNFRITAIRLPSRFSGKTYDLAESACTEDDEPRTFLGIHPCYFDDSPGRQFILKEEWEAERAAKIAQMEEYPQSMRAAKC